MIIYKDKNVKVLKINLEIRCKIFDYIWKVGQNIRPYGFFFSLDESDRIFFFPFFGVYLTKRILLVEKKS